MAVNDEASSGVFDEISIMDILSVLVHKTPQLIAVGIAAGVMVYLAVSLLVSPRYVSKVSFYVYNSPESANAEGGIDNSDVQASKNLTSTYAKILESNTVLEAVFKRISGGGEIDREDLADMTEVSVVTDTQLLEIEVTASDPQLAYQIADAYSRVAQDEIVRVTKAGGVEVVDYPEVAGKKSGPRTLFDACCGAIACVVLASMAFVLLSLSDQTIYLPEDIDALTQASLLGQIPNIETSADSRARWTLQRVGGDQR